MSNYEQNFSFFEKRVEFKTKTWKTWKGPILNQKVNKISLKIIDSVLLDDPTISESQDSIYFEFGCCTLDYTKDTLGWDMNSWSFGSGELYGLFQTDWTLSYGSKLKKNDIITLSFDLNKYTMSVDINGKDHGVAYDNLKDDICFAICSRGDLTVEFMIEVDNWVLKMLERKKSLNIFFNFQ